MELSWEMSTASPNMTFSYSLDEAAWLWKKLGFGAEPPRGCDYKTACEIALGIWQLGLSHGIAGHPLIIKQALIQTLGWGAVELSGQHITFDDLREKALEAGVDCQIDAWLSGVPLEYVLAV